MNIELIESLINQKSYSEVLQICSKACCEEKNYEEAGLLRSELQDTGFIVFIVLTTSYSLRLKSEPK